MSDKPEIKLYHLERRAFTKRFVTGAACVAVCSACSNNNTQLLTEDEEVVLADHRELEEVGNSLKLDVGLSRPLAITRQRDDTFVVTSTECPHARCEVSRNGSGWACPCHGARFALDGSLERGPAKSPLTSYDSELDKDAGILTIFSA